MDIEELMALERAWTPEEQVFFEQELLRKVREAHAAVMTLTEDLGEEHAADVARLRASATRMLENVEAAAAISRLEDEPGEMLPGR